MNNIRRIILPLIFLLACMLPMAAQAVSWSDLTAGLGTGGSFTLDGTTITFSGYTYAISGGTVSDVSIREAGEDRNVDYQFDDVTLTGGFSAEAQDGALLTVWINETVTDKTGGLSFLADNSVYDEEEQESPFYTQLYAYVNAKDSHVSAESKRGATLYLYAEQKIGALNAAAKQLGRLLFNNDQLWDFDTYLPHLLADAVTLTTEGGQIRGKIASSTKLTANACAYISDARSYGGNILLLCADKTQPLDAVLNMDLYSSLSIEGDYLLGKTDASLPIRVNLNQREYSGDSDAKLSATSKVMAMDVDFIRVVCTKNGVPQIRVSADYKDGLGRSRQVEFMLNPWKVTTSNVVGSVSGDVTQPTLVIGDKDCQDNWTLRSLMYSVHESATDYTLNVTDEDGKDADFSSVSADKTLYLPYPDSIPANERRYYEYRVFVSYYDANTGRPMRRPAQFEATANGIAVSDMNGSCRFELYYNRIDGACANFYDLLAELHVAINNPANADRNVISVSKTFTDEVYPLGGNTEFTTTASYNRETDTTTISGGRIGSAHIANRFADGYPQLSGMVTIDGESRHIEFGLDSGTYVFKDILILDDLYIFNEDTQDFKVVLEDTVGGKYDLTAPAGAPRRGGFSVDANFLYSGGSLHLVNDTTIKSANFYSLSVGIDCGHSFTLSGSGRILVGEGLHYHPVVDELELQDDRPMRLSINAMTDNNEEARSMIQHTLSSDLDVDLKQFRDVGHSRIARIDVCRISPDREWFPMNELPIPVYSSKADLANADPDIPRLLIADGRDTDMMTLVAKEWSISGGSHYELELYDTESCSPTIENAELYLPYADGIDYESAQGKVLTVYHYTLAGEEIFITHPELYPDHEHVQRLTLTPYGLMLNVSSFSPYFVEAAELPEGYGDAIAPEASPDTDDLPKTGDDSHPMLYAAALLLSCGAMIALRRRSRA